MSAPEKQEVIAAALKSVSNKIDRIKAELDDLNDGNAQNSKSTAGDKHDTERAMVHLEIEKLSTQLANEIGIRHDLEKINPILKTNQVSNGSMVHTNQGVFFIGASVGKVLIEDFELFFISVGSPLAKALIGKSTGDSIKLNMNNFIITGVS